MNGENMKLKNHKIFFGILFLFLISEFQNCTHPNVAIYNDPNFKSPVGALSTDTDPILDPSPTPEVLPSPTPLVLPTPPVVIDLRAGFYNLEDITNALTLKNDWKGGTNQFVLDKNVELWDPSYLALNNGFGNYKGTELIIQRDPSGNLPLSFWMDNYYFTAPFSYVDGVVFYNNQEIAKNLLFTQRTLHFKFTGDVSQDLLNKFLQNIRYQNTQYLPESEITFKYTFENKYFALKKIKIFEKNRISCTAENLSGPSVFQGQSLKVKEGSLAVAVCQLDIQSVENAALDVELSEWGGNAKPGSLITDQTDETGFEYQIFSQDTQAWGIVQQAPLEEKTPGRFTSSIPIPEGVMKFRIQARVLENFDSVKNPEYDELFAFIIDANNQPGLNILGYTNPSFVIKSILAP